MLQSPFLFVSLRMFMCNTFKAAVNMRFFTWYENDNSIKKNNTTLIAWVDWRIRLRLVIDQWSCNKLRGYWSPTMMGVSTLFHQGRGPLCSSLIFMFLYFIWGAGEFYQTTWCVLVYISGAYSILEVTWAYCMDLRFCIFTTRAQ